MGDLNDGALPRLMGTLDEQDGEARARVLGPTFLLRTRDGGIEDGAVLGAGFERLRRAFGAGELNELGSSYALLESEGGDNGAEPEATGNDPGDAGYWLIHLADGERLGAAFEFRRRSEALGAVPPNVLEHAAIDIVREAVWAFVEQDVGRLMGLLASDFSYTDSVRGTTLNGAAQVVNGLLLTFTDLRERGIAGLELTELTDELVQTEGVLTRSLGEDSSIKWRWRTISAVLDGRIRWTVREPDVREE